MRSHEVLKLPFCQHCRVLILIQNIRLFGLYTYRTRVLAYTFYNIFMYLVDSSLSCSNLNCTVTEPEIKFKTTQHEHILHRLTLTFILGK